MKRNACVLLTCFALVAIPRLAFADTCDELEPRLQALERSKGPEQALKQLLEELKQCDAPLHRAKLATRVARLLEARVQPPESTGAKATAPGNPADGKAPRKAGEAGGAASSKRGAPPVPRQSRKGLEPSAKPRESATLPVPSGSFELALKTSLDGLSAYIEALTRTCSGDISTCPFDQVRALLDEVMQFLQQVLRIEAKNEWVRKAASLLNEIPVLNPAVLLQLQRLLENPEFLSASATGEVTHAPEWSQLSDELRGILQTPEGQERVKRLVSYLLSGDEEQRAKRRADYALAVRLADEETARRTFESLARHGQVRVLLKCDDAGDAQCSDEVQPLVEQKLTSTRTPGQLVFDARGDGQQYDVEIGLQLVEPTSAAEMLPCKSRGTRGDRCILAKVRMDSGERAYWSAPFASPGSPGARVELESQIAGIIRRVAEGVASAYSYRDQWIGPVRVVNDSLVDARPCGPDVSALPMGALARGLFLEPTDSAEFPRLASSLRDRLALHQVDVLQSIASTWANDGVALQTVVSACQPEAVDCRRLAFKLVHRVDGTRKRLMCFTVEAPPGDQFVSTIAREASERIIAYYLSQRAAGPSPSRNVAEAPPVPAPPPALALLFAGLPHPEGSEARSNFSYWDFGFSTAAVTLTLASTMERHAYSDGGSRTSLHAANGLLAAGAVAFTGVLVTRIVSWLSASRRASGSHSAAAASHSSRRSPETASSRAFREDPYR